MYSCAVCMPGHGEDPENGMLQNMLEKISSGEPRPQLYSHVTPGILEVIIHVLGSTNLRQAVSLPLCKMPRVDFRTPGNHIYLCACVS